MIRKATLDDAYTLARLREAMLLELHPGARPDSSFRERTFVYWYEMIGQGLATAWVVEVDGETVGMAAVLYHHHPPRLDKERRRGYVSAVYINPAWRHRGLARELMHVIIAHGREEGWQRLELRSTHQARTLYTELGFEPQEVLMLNLR